MTLSPVTKSPFKVVSAEDKPLKNKWEGEIDALCAKVLADSPTSICFMWENTKEEMPYRTLPESYNVARGFAMRFDAMIFDTDYKDPSPIAANPAVSIWEQEVAEVKALATAQCPTSFCALWEPAAGGMRVQTIPASYNLTKGYALRFHEALFTEGTDEGEYE